MNIFSVPTNIIVGNRFLGARFNSQHAYTDKGVPEKMDLHPSIDDFTDTCTYFCHKKYGIAKKVVTISTHRL